MALSVLLREIRHDRALKRINETDAKNVIADLGDFRIGGGGRDHRDLVFLADRRGFQRTLEATSPRIATTPSREISLCTTVAGSPGLGLVVFGEQLEFFAEHAARGVDFFDRQRGALWDELAEGGLLPVSEANSPTLISPPAAGVASGFVATGGQRAQTNPATTESIFSLIGWQR